MPAKRRTIVSFESLERRDNPSVLVAAAAHHARPVASHTHRPVMTHQQTLQVNGSGSAILSGSPDLSGSQATVSGSATITAARLGTLTGTLTSTFSTTGTSASAQGVFSAADGSSLDLAFNIQSNGNLSQGTFKGSFSVLGGTGRFAGATGGGSVTNGLVDLAGQSLSFKLSGRLTP